MMYIVIDEDNNIVSYGKSGDIEITSWPQKNGDPAPKSECYWNGTQVVLKTNGQLVTEYKKQEFQKLTDYVKDHWIKADRTPNEIRLKVREKSVTFNSKAEVDAAIEEIKTYLYNP